MEWDGLPERVGGGGVKGGRGERMRGNSCLIHCHQAPERFCIQIARSVIHFAVSLLWRAKSQESVHADPKTVCTSLSSGEAEGDPKLIPG